MGILLIFAFLSGLVTIAAPCIWPILPIVLSSAATGGKGRPLGITLGVVTSFSILTLSIAYIIRIIPFDPEILRYISVAVILFFGISLLIPAFGAIIEGAVSKLGAKFRSSNSTQGSDFKVGFLTGLSLGVVWTPCAGPILAAIATLAATRNVSAEIIILTAVYMAGVAIPLFIFSFFGQKIFTKSAGFSKYTGRVQQIFGIIMVVTAIMIATGYDRTLQVKLLDAFPSYSGFITKLESNDKVKNQLDKLRGTAPKDENAPTMAFPKAEDQALPKLGNAPNFTGIANWINSKSLTIEDLRGNVVLVDFWTYTCINCIRTLPYVTGWYEKYKPTESGGKPNGTKPGLIVIGVHTPEFEFEKKTENVEKAVKQYKINYPVAQDNDYATWQAYENHYWPAKYLIDAQGIVRYTHFGEGEYDVTEKNIQKLLKEAGMAQEKELLSINEPAQTGGQTPETYLGLSRMAGFASQENPKVGLQTYSLPKSLNQNNFAFVGAWDLQDEYAQVGEKGAGLLFKFYAKNVYLVITPKSVDDQIAVFLDDKSVTDMAGKDVEKGYVKIDEPRLYHLIDLDEKSEHLLQLNFQTPGTQIFAFTFGS